MTINTHIYEMLKPTVVRVAKDEAKQGSSPQPGTGGQGKSSGGFGVHLHGWRVPALSPGGRVGVRIHLVEPRAAIVSLTN